MFSLLLRIFGSTSVVPNYEEYAQKKRGTFSIPASQGVWRNLTEE